jgi:anti-anti-sigma regulatory factor
MLRIETDYHPLGITILELHGELDGSTFQQLIDHVDELTREGTHNVLLDLEHMTYISSAGLIALQSIIKMLKGEAPPDLEDGWSAFDALERDREGGLDKNLKLCRVTDQVRSSLERVGFTQYVAIYNSRKAALVAFT